MIATLFKLSFSGIRSRLLASMLTIMLTGAAAATDRAHPRGRLDRA